MWTHVQQEDVFHSITTYNSKNWEQSKCNKRRKLPFAVAIYLGMNLTKDMKTSIKKNIKYY